jgi:peroxiredoxin family protein
VPSRVYFRFLDDDKHDKNSNSHAISKLLDITELEGVQLIACKMKADMMQLDESYF